MGPGEPRALVSRISPSPTPLMNPGSYWLTVLLLSPIASPSAQEGNQRTAGIARPSQVVSWEVRERPWYGDLARQMIAPGACLSSAPGGPGRIRRWSLWPPVILSTQASIEREGLPTYLDAEGMDIDGRIVLWEWDFEGDGVFDHASSVGPGVFFTYPAQGQYRARLRATDDAGRRDSAGVDVTVEPPSVETVTDVDGNVYQTVRIGDQTWMIENLKTTTFNDGTPITEHVFPMSWNPGFGLYRWADTSDLGGLYDPQLPFDFYGAMYNDAALSSGRLAPAGWRIPSEQDWLELVTFLAGDGFAGNEATALKTTFGWAQSSGSGADAYGFRGLPAGYVSAFGTSTGSPVIAAFATTTRPTASTRLIAHLFDAPQVLFFENNIALGAAVRCVKE